MKLQYEPLLCSANNLTVVKFYSSEVFTIINGDLFIKIGTLCSNDNMK